MRPVMLYSVTDSSESSHSSTPMFEMSASDIAMLMQKHRSELLRFLARRVKCSETAMDIFQDTFIRYAGYTSKNPIQNPKALIFKIATNLSTDYLRSHSRRAKLIDDQNDVTEDVEDFQPSPEQSVISEQQLEQLIDALAELPPKCRKVFILLKLKHYSYAQVSEELGISQTMILKYLNRALKHCRTRLEDFA